ncbi:MAG: GTP pyrophosphokinase [Deltaproteobacteria bacterium GWA2_38_16]|nr:MAG: GTP pyrophosphokinase [Deltaproteobacteria bacterium GWA2_38_16]OGQ03184.1 MAG: GTP pyrophosphokinase [Deltaproteobacteria bacterium RIFCSPHIGHO2_02_FULL_38_15]OGQ33887.1 MAG: GTP pyrophosphokinase [Deltaproteobacteria bacterium RIFCSPLOWO2_01_FULL_38_9]HBQ20392.1 GTP pyrophosphokinase [Deltaproteobacteria bacterium]
MTLLLEDLFKSICAYYPDADLTLIKKACDFSEKAHRGQTRASGEAYVSHPLEVAMILTRLHMDIPSIVAAILHDTIEDTGATFEFLEKEFGKEIAELVDGVTKLSRLTFKNVHEKQAENFRKMILATAQDIRVMLIKLSDRLHNMRTLAHLPISKQLRIAQETADIYAPIANRLGIGWMKMELEDLSLKYLKPEIYESLVEKVVATRTNREGYIEKVQEIIREKLKEQNLNFIEVMGRPKHFFSIYKKMETRNLEFEQIYDVIAFRIIVHTLSECYEALGIIHSVWKPVPGRFKDFIAMPKANSYQSLHTTVIGPGGDRLEIQIRTEEMHHIADEGIAAHWEYKAGNMSKKDVERFSWIRQLLEWQKELRDPSEFLDTMKLDLFPGDVYVFTPKGEVMELPRGATPIDFAYAVHTTIGHRCIGAKVNGKIVPLRYVLKSGDTIEILTQATPKPNKEWLSFVHSSRAKAKIRSFIKVQERAKGLELGRAICEKAFRKQNLSFSKFVDTSEFSKAASELGHKDPQGVLVAIGYGLIQPSQLFQKLFPSEEIKKEESEKPSLLKQIFQKAAKKSKAKAAIKIKGEEDVLVRFAHCCNPLPGDPIIGFVTRGRGVSVHQAGCAKMFACDPDRKIDVEWDLDTKVVRHHIKVKVVCKDEPGLLVEMSRVFTSRGVNISQAQIRTTRDKKAISTFEVDIMDLEQLQKVMKAMEALPGVISVERI